MAYIGSSPTKVVSRQSANIFTYTATANQTAFTGADANGNTLACSPSDIMVHMNGIKLEESDYTATTTTVTLGSGAAAGDEVTITAFLTFESADHYTKSAADTRYVNTTGDTMTGGLAINTSTTETIAVNSANYGGIQFKAGGTNTGYVTSYTDGSGAESMYIGGADTVNLHTGTNHALTGGTTRLKIDASGNVTMPSQPAFKAWGQDSSTTSNGKIVFGSASQNGSHFSTANSRFTCPVNGWYLFFCQGLTHQAGTRLDLQFKVNGSTIIKEERQYKTSNNHESFHIEVMHYLSANDYVELHKNYGDSGVYTWQHWSFFQGFLVA